MTQPRIVIAGVGLIGGSLGLALRRAGAHVVGLDASAAVLERAQQRGAIDEGSVEPAAARGADWVVLATPVNQLGTCARWLAPHLLPRARVTDVGSVKRAVVAELSQALGKACYVGAHPMFGTAGQGIEHADGALVRGATFLLTPTAQSDEATVDALADLARSLEMRPLRLSPEEHDRQLAQVSHLPHLLAWALVQTVDDAKTAGPTFRDMTRVAASSPEQWTSIFDANRDYLREALRRLQSNLDVLASLEGPALQAALEALRTRKSRLLPP